MNTTHSLVWFGHNLVTTLYEIYFKSKFCSFRVLNQEFGGKSENIGGHLGTRFLDVCGKYKITVNLCYLNSGQFQKRQKDVNCRIKVTAQLLRSFWWQGVIERCKASPTSLLLHTHHPPPTPPLPPHSLSRADAGKLPAPDHFTC